MAQPLRHYCFLHGDVATFFGENEKYRGFHCKARSTYQACKRLLRHLNRWKRSPIDYRVDYEVERWNEDGSERQFIDMNEMKKNPIYPYLP